MASWIQKYPFVKSVLVFTGPSVPQASASYGTKPINPPSLSAPPVL